MNLIVCQEKRASSCEETKQEVISPLSLAFESNHLCKTTEGLVTIRSSFFINDIVTHGTNEEDQHKKDLCAPAFLLLFQMDFAFALRSGSCE